VDHAPPVALAAARPPAASPGALGLDVARRRRPPRAAGRLRPAGLAPFGLGAIVAALAPTAAAANGWGMALYFVSLFFAGVWLPLPIMPQVVQDIAVLTPLGAATQAMTAAWFGLPFPGTETLVLAAWALVATPLAVRLFRWT